MINRAMMANYADSETVKSSRSQFPLSLDEIVTIDNLMIAFHNAVVGRKHRAKIFNYGENLGINIINLRDRLINREYHPRPCSTFEIFCTAGQKVRTIAAPAFEDTIVQHLLYGAIYDYVDRTLIFDSYGCRRNKGTHKAGDRVQKFMREAPEGSYYLQIDIRKYYYSIQHEILRESIERRIADKEIVDLLIEFCGDGKVGLNVGSLLSQLYGMIYLDRFDHWVKRILKVRHYVRFVDDCLFILPSKEAAQEVKEKCDEFLWERLKLRLSKWRIAPISRGVNFVGLRTWPSHRIIRKRSLHNFGKRLRQGRLDSIVSILGHAKDTSSYSHLIDRCLSELSIEQIRQLPKSIKEAMANKIMSYPAESEDVPVMSDELVMETDFRDVAALDGSRFFLYDAKTENIPPNSDL